MVANALMAKEHALLDAVKNRDMKTFSSLVKPGSWSADENGFMTVDDFIKALGDPKTDIRIDMLEVSDMKVVAVDPSSAIASSGRRRSSASPC